MGKYGELKKPFWLLLVISMLVGVGHKWCGRILRTLRKSLLDSEEESPRL